MRALVSNPPYNMPWEIPQMIGFIPGYYGFATPPKGNANYAFIIQGLSFCDKGAILLPNSVINPTGTEKEILERLIRLNYLTAVILLPDKMFESTSIATCILIVERNRKTRRIAFVDLREKAVKETREQNGQFGGASHTGRTYKKDFNVLPISVMQDVVDALSKGEGNDYIAFVDQETIIENDFNIQPTQYFQKTFETKHRSFHDIAEDYNRVIRFKNAVHVTFNETAAKRLDYYSLKRDTLDDDLAKSFELVGEKIERENWLTFTKSDGIVIKCSTKEDLPEIVLRFLSAWSNRLYFLNCEANRLLAEMRDAMLPALMSGEIDVSKVEL